MVGIKRKVQKIVDEMNWRWNEVIEVKEMRDEEWNENEAVVLEWKKLSSRSVEIDMLNQGNEKKVLKMLRKKREIRK